ncbi:30S ribosomal protein S9 [Patescibacteria group bacterium]|nr:30S ribosomal protein S9 [Patescibacteria group bacterium]
MALKLNKKKKVIKKIIKKSKPVKKLVKRVESETSSNLIVPTGKYYEAIGRRKVATARVRIYESEGDFIVNDKVVGQYFGTISDAKLRYNKPFELTGTKGKFSITAIVSGSGSSSQLDAVVHGISRALEKYDPTFRALLKPEGLLKRDDRMKETRKIGMGGKARRKRQSPKR